MSTPHEQARAEAEKRYPYRTHDTEVMQWQKRQHRVTFTDGFLAGHEAATRTRVDTTVTELDALPIGSVVLDDGSYVMHKVWGIPEPDDHWSYLGTAHPAAPARVLFDEENR